MQINWKQNMIFMVGIIIIITLLLLSRLLSGKPFVQKNKNLLNAMAFLVILGLLAWHFYEKKLFAGLIAVGLGGIAFGKYLYDTSVSQKKD
jgi:peptidoglycan/LPS O-acetylase OafA/YrhL